MVGTRRLGIGLFFFLSTAALAVGCSGKSAPKDHEPVANDDTATTNENTAVSIDVLANDTDADTKDVLTIENVGTPAHGTAVVDNGKVLYTPATNYFGSDTFTYTISDGRTFTPPPGANVTVTITHVNQPPVAVADSATTAEDTATDIDVVANDTDADGDTLTITAVTQPAHGTATIASNKIHYVPTANFNGADAIGYTISDGNGGTASGTASITITPVDDAPVANADAWSGVEDTTLSIPAPGVLGNDTDVDGPSLTAILVAQATKGTVTLAADGSFTYVPNANANGTDTFTYKANDGTLDSNVVTVTLSIAPVNDPPVAANDAYTTNEDTPLTANAANGVLANDSDIDSPTITAVLVSGPSKGTLSLAADGSFTYTPNANVNGTDSFQYQANDGSLSSAVATVTITINPVDDAPVANADAYSTNEDTPLVVSAAAGVLANDTDVDGPSLSAIQVTAPTKGTLSLAANGSFSYTPNANVNGTDTFTYKANDGTLDSATNATVTITIAAVNDAPSFTAGANQTVLEDAGAQSIAGWATSISPGPVDEAAQNVTFQVSADAPSLFSAGPSVAANGTLSFTPAPDANGVANVTVKAHDDGGTANGGVDTSAPQTFTITITPVNDAPSFTSGGDLTVAEDSGAYVNAWATNVSAGPANESAQHLTFVVTGDSNASMFSLPPAVTPGGVLSFESAPNANGDATITLHLADDGGTANGGVDQTGDVTLTIHVTPVDDPPVANGDDVSTNENAALAIAATTLTANDTDIDGPSIAVDFATVTQPSHGTVTVAGSTITYTPAANYHGTDSFTYRDTDGTLFSPFATVHVDVALLDLPPSFTKGADVSVIQDSGAYTATGWATSISEGAGESGQALSFSAIASNPSLFATQPAIDASGNLTFTPAPAASGTSTVTVTLTDDNGSPADPSDDATSAPQVFTISVIAKPSFDLAGDQIYDQGTGTHVVSGFAHDIVSSGTPNFEVYFDNGSLFSSGAFCPPNCSSPVSIDSTGTLTVELAPGTQGSFGIAHVTVVMTDSATGAQSSRTFTITVNYVNQPPTYSLNTTSIVLLDTDTTAHGYSGAATNLFPGANDEFNQLLSFTVTPDNGSVFATAPSIDGAGTLHLDPNGTATANQTVTLTVILHDDGRKPDGTFGTPAQSAPQLITVTFHDATQPPVFVSSTPSNGSFVNQQTSGFFTFGGPDELTPMKLLFDSPDLDCAGMRGAGDVTVLDLTSASAFALSSSAIGCGGDVVNGQTVPDGQIWISFPPFDSKQEGDQIQVDVTNIHGVVSGGNSSQTILFTYDDRPPTANYVGSQSNPFFGGCAPANTRAIFQFNEPIATSTSGFSFALQNFPNPPTPVLADPAGEGFADLDQADDLFYFVPNDLLTSGNYQVTLGFADVAGNPVQNPNLNFGVCGGPGPTGTPEPALTQIAFRQPSTGVIDAVVTAAQISNGGFLAPPGLDGSSDDVILSFDRTINPGANGSIHADGGPGTNGFNVAGFESNGVVAFHLTQQFPTPTFQAGTRYSLSFSACDTSGSCSGQSLQFFVQTTGAPAPFVDALVARGARASDGAVPAVRPEEPWFLGLTGQVDPRTLVPGNFSLMDGSGNTYPVVVNRGDTHLDAVALAFRAVDAAGRPVALPPGSYTFTESGLLDIDSPQNPVPAAAFALDVVPHPSIPQLVGVLPQDGQRIAEHAFGNPIDSIFASFSDLMSPSSFRDTGNPATRGFSLEERYVGSLNHEHYLLLKGLAPGTPGCCNNTSPTDDLLSTVQLAFSGGAFGGTPPAGFETGRTYRFRPLGGLQDVDEVSIAPLATGTAFTFAVANDTDATASPTIQSYTFGGQLFPAGAFTCSVCGGTPQSGFTAQAAYWDPTANSVFTVFGPGILGSAQSLSNSVTTQIAVGPLPAGDDVVTFEAEDRNSGLASRPSFEVHVPQPLPAPIGVVSTNGTTVTVQGGIPAVDGPAVARIEMTIVLTNDSTGTPDIRAFGPGAIANVVRAADGSLTYSQTFDASTFPTKSFPGAAYHALVIASLPDGLTRDFNGGGGGGNGSNPGSVDEFVATPAIPAQGPPPAPATFSGTVMNLGSNGQPVPNASVELFGTAGSTLTGSAGGWSLNVGIPTGQSVYVHSTGPSGFFDGWEPELFTGSLSGLGPNTISDVAFQAFLPTVSLSSGDVLVTTNNSILQQGWVNIGAPSTPAGNVNGGTGAPAYLFENATPGDWTVTITPGPGNSCSWNTKGGAEAAPYTNLLHVGSHGFTTIEIDCK